MVSVTKLLNVTNFFFNFFQNLPKYMVDLHTETSEAPQKTSNYEKLQIEKNNIDDEDCVSTNSNASANLNQCNKYENKNLITKDKEMNNDLQNKDVQVLENNFIADYSLKEQKEKNNTIQREYKETLLKDSELSGDKSGKLENFKFLLSVRSEALYRC